VRGGRTIVRIAEAHVPVVHIEEPLVGDGHAVRAATDVLDDLPGPGEQRQRILPIVTAKRLSSITRIIL
jgi:hypothetical protein